jgi:hypothetical protein
VWGSIPYYVATDPRIQVFTQLFGGLRDMIRYTEQQELEFEQILIEFIIWLINVIIETLEMMGIEYEIEMHEQAVDITDPRI